MTTDTHTIFTARWRQAAPSIGFGPGVVCDQVIRVVKTSSRQETEKET